MNTHPTDENHTPEGTSIPPRTGLTPDALRQRIHQQGCPPTMSSQKQSRLPFPRILRTRIPKSIGMPSAPPTVRKASPTIILCVKASRPTIPPSRPSRWSTTSVRKSPSPACSISSSPEAPKKISAHTFTTTSTFPTSVSTVVVSASAMNSVMSPSSSPTISWKISARS